MTLIQKFQAAVIGAGPAGLAAVGLLLDFPWLHSILWIDPKFNAGRLSHYTSVPSNTKVKYFLQYFYGTKTFRDIIKSQGEASAEEDLLANLRGLDAEKECQLSVAKEAVGRLTSSVLSQRADRLVSCEATVKSMSYDPLKKEWLLSTDKSDQYRADLVVFATGSHPRMQGDPPHKELAGLYACFSDQASFITIDDALCPESLNRLIDAKDTVCVIGNSHSAMLAIMNLCKLPAEKKPGRIINLYRLPLRYAEYKEDYILFDNTGLKGLVAEWTKTYVDNESQKRLLPELTLIPLYDQHGRNFALDAELDIVRRSTTDVTKYILAIGFARNVLPTLEFVDEKNNLIPVDMKNITYNPCSAELIVKDSSLKDGILPQAYGCGIAFPEKVVDPAGNVEEAVGLWKFMKYIQEKFPPHLEKYQSQQAVEVECQKLSN